MKMVNIMQYKTIIYIIMVFLSAYALTGINFEKFMKSNKIVEAKIIVVILCFISSYLLTNFIVDFLNFNIG